MFIIHKRNILGGFHLQSGVNTIDYVEIATTGNALDFGDLTIQELGNTCLSSPTRGIFAGGSLLEWRIEFYYNCIKKEMH